MLKRTHYCGELRPDHVGRQVVVSGWVATWRDHGGLVFIDVRDRTGLAQAVFNPELDAELHRRAGELRSEWCVSIRGEVARRPEGMVNPALATGEVEIVASELELHSRSDPPPFDVERPGDVSLEARLRYRFLDLRRPEVLRIFATRHRVLQATRRYFDEHGFIEVETPVLTKSTPEGARDYLVPSRMAPGSFYALPQSPQLFKQTLMIAGLDRYFQIVKCFRDEGVRASRQPEFTQIDVEMSFVDEADVMGCIEGLVARLFKQVADHEISLPLPRIRYAEALDRYGTDAPDLRFGIEIADIDEVAGECDFKVFREAVRSGDTVRGICVPGGAALSRREIDGLIEWVKQFGLPGLAWFKLEAGAAAGGVAKFLSPSQVAAVAERLGAGDGSLLLFAAAARGRTDVALAHLRRHVAGMMGLIPEGEYNLCWVVEPPAFEADPETGALSFPHHPFTAPVAEDVELLRTDPTAARSRAYDLVMNGTELGGGSIRISDRDLQMRVFNILGYSEDEVQERFGFFMDALRYGPPPHGGIALGVDRVVGGILGLEDIRETIAFPKTLRGVCMLTGAPSPVPPEQLRELGLRLDQP